MLCGCGSWIKGGQCVSFRVSCCGCVVAVVVVVAAAVAAAAAAVIVAAVIPRKMSSKQRKLAKRFLLFWGFVSRGARWKQPGVGAREL